MFETPPSALQLGSCSTSQESNPQVRDCRLLGCWKEYDVSCSWATIETCDSCPWRLRASMPSDQWQSAAVAESVQLLGTTWERICACLGRTKAETRGRARGKVRRGCIRCV